MVLAELKVALVLLSILLLVRVPVPFPAVRKPRRGISGPEELVGEARDGAMPPRAAVDGPVKVRVVVLLHAVVHVLDEVLLETDEGLGVIVRVGDEKLAGVDVIGCM